MANLNDVTTPELQAIRKRAAELPATNYIISLDNPKQRTKAGHIFVTDARLAAECEYNMTHRLCTKAEVEAYLAAEEKLRQSIIERENARRANFNVNVTVPAQVAPPQPQPKVIVDDEPLIDRKKGK